MVSSVIMRQAAGYSGAQARRRAPSSIIGETSYMKG